MYVLGISGGLGHDAAAALVADGQILAMAEEDRFTRIKHAWRASPINAAAYCLAAAGITMSDVDYLALGWEPQPHTLPVHEHLLRHPAIAGRRRPAVLPVGHHHAHAAAAYFCSGFDDAAILIADGSAETDVATTFVHGRGHELHTLRALDVTQSLGVFYQAASGHLGFGLGDTGFGEEGKTMGLAAYAEADLEITPITLTEDGYAIAMADPGVDPSVKSDYVLAAWLQWFGARRTRPQITQRYEPAAGRVARRVELRPEDQRFAASAQKALEDALIRSARALVAATGAPRLVVSGGVALNCAANGALARSGVAGDLYVFPAGGDAGTSAGAALAVYYDLTREAPRGRVERADFGPAFSPDDVSRVVEAAGIRARGVDDPAIEAARLLAQGKIIGWFQGRMEVGPRALGQRSILAPTRPREVLDRVNRLKGREAWRPLAPMMTPAAAGRYLVDPRPSPFMLTTAEVKAAERTEIAAVVHVDGSCRPQITDNPLLRAIEAESGEGIVLNTSFNCAGEPIVCTPLDALRTFYAMGLDALIMETTVITK